MVGGFISDIFGGRQPCLWGNGMSAIFMFLQVPAVYIGPVPFFICRMLNGFFSVSIIIGFLLARFINKK